MSPQDLIFFLSSSSPQRTVTYIQSVQAPTFLLLQPKPRKWFSNGLVLGVQLFPLTTKVQAFRPQFKRNLIGFSPKPPRFSSVKRFAANDDESVVVGLDEAEKEGRAPSTMPERFQRLFKEAPDPPLRWPWFVAGEVQNVVVVIQFAKVKCFQGTIKSVVIMIGVNHLAPILNPMIFSMQINYFQSSRKDVFDVIEDAFHVPEFGIKLLTHLSNAYVLFANHLLLSFDISYTRTPLAID